MTKLAVEASTVQFPLVDHAAAAGWERVSDKEALRKRRGEGGLFFYDELEAALLRLNPGVVTPADVPGIVQRLESLPNTIAGNREVLDWLRGKQTIYVDSAKRHRTYDMESHDQKFKRPEIAGVGIPAGCDRQSTPRICTGANAAAGAGLGARASQALPAFRGLDMKEPAPPP